MTRWKYMLNSGSALREAIDNENLEQTRECLLLCYKELLNKLSDEDAEIYRLDICDEYSSLEVCDLDEECLDDYLGRFYGICDDVGAFVRL